MKRILGIGLVLVTAYLGSEAYAGKCCGIWRARVKFCTGDYGKPEGTCTAATTKHMNPDPKTYRSMRYADNPPRAEEVCDETIDKKSCDNLGKTYQP